MTITVDSYLDELERLLASVDPALRQELVDGIREELAALSPEEAEARLRELGDPAYVAVGMLAETRSAAPAPAALREPEEEGDAAWYPVLTVVLLTIGIVPVLGWVVGLIMLWAAKGWRMLHKVVGTVLAFGAPGLVILGLFSFQSTGATISTPVTSGGGNPIIPPLIESPFPGWVVFVLVLGLVWIVGWIWLLIAHRARR